MKPDPEHTRIHAPGLHLKGALSMRGAPVFGPLSVRVEGGRWTCIVGRSGCGKTSLLKVLAGLIGAPDFTGSVGTDDGAPLQGRIAWMAQSDLLLPWASALDNIALGARLRGEAPDMDRARAALRAVGLEAHAAETPAALSGGMRQRVALARTLVENRPVVLLDEPFSALDAVNRDALQTLAFEALAGRTVVLVTHDPLEAMRMGVRVLVMEAEALSEPVAPPGPPPRAIEDPKTLRAQAQLVAWMKGRAR